MKRLATLLLALATVAFTFAAAPKREFRGAWIQAVNHQFEGIPTAELKAELSRQLDSLASCGINAILFQVRVEADALYKSDLEPWSAYLTGFQGEAPDEDWDPLQFMIDQCHARCMELHAWINPFRAKTKPTTEFAPTHQMKLHPERIIKYGDLALFNPALQENRDYICQVAADIVTRYDIDGFHIDDYFYPYPDGNLKFNDDASFRKDPRGFKDKDDWRRDNVNLFVEQLYNTVKGLKPWVKFGISPFGIYRNKSAQYPEGSETTGLENYSGLYADVLYWIREGWIDYVCPQLYWHIGNRAADYNTLAHWWAQRVDEANLEYAKKAFRRLTTEEIVPPASRDDIIHPSPVPITFCKLYIGMAPYRLGSEKEAAAWRTGNEIDRQMKINRTIPQIEGECFYSTKPLLRNPLGVCDTIRNYYLPQLPNP